MLFHGVSHLQLILSLLRGRAGGSGSCVVALVRRLGGSRRGAGGALGGSSRRAGDRLGDGRRGRRGGLSSRSSQGAGRTGGAGRSRAGGRGSTDRSRASAGSSSVGGRDNRGGSKTELGLEPVGSTSEAVGGSVVLVTSLGGSGTIGRLDGSRSAVAIKTGTVLAGKSEELVALGALGNLDTVAVGPLLDLAVRPRVEESVAEALLSSGGGGRDGSVSTLGVQAGEAGLAAHAGNERVAGRWLGNIVATLVEPSLDVRVRPRGVEPVTGVGSGLAELVGGGLVVFTDSLEKGVTLAGLGNGDAVLVGKSLDLRVGPAMMC
jgi:hypothetical protein